MNSNKSTLILLIVFLSIFTACSGNQSASDDLNNVNDLATESEQSDTSVESPLNNGDLMQNTLNTDQNQADRIARTQQELLGRNESPQVVPGSMRYKVEVAPYNRFADSEGYLKLVGVDLSEIENVLGPAPAMVKLSREGAPVRREVRVYMPYDQDATGLYIYILNEKVQHFRMDEFNGITNSSIMDFFNNN